MKGGLAASVVSIILVFLLFADQTTGSAQGGPDKAAEERAAVVDCVNAIGTAADLNDWGRVRGCFADKVLLDYVSLVGGQSAVMTADQIVAAWKGFLPGFELTRHALTNHEVRIEGQRARCFSYVDALHYVAGAEGGETWRVVGYYHHQLVRTAQGWKVEAMRFTKTLQEGNLKLPETAGARVRPKVRRVSFDSHGATLAGQLYLPGDHRPGQRRPGIVVGGSWTTVKEQMAGRYAEELSRLGLAALAFDHRGFGESQGSPRDCESPAKKIEDFKSALAFMQTVSEVDGHRLGALGVCASAGYLAVAAAEDARLKSLALVAAWLHEPETVRLVYGGEEGVQARLKAGRAAREKFERTGQVNYVPAISTTDQNAAMYGQFDYYLDPKRGAVPQWGNRFAVMAWPEWLEFNPLAVSGRIKIPVALIHSREAALPQGVEKFFQGLPGPKALLWLAGGHFTFYDDDGRVREATRLAADHFRKTLP